MRNEWYPANKAEYMTGIRFQQLGLSRHEVGERDRGYAPLPPSANVNRELVLEVKTTTLQSKPKAQPKPERAPAPVLPSEPEPAVVAHLPVSPHVSLSGGVPGLTSHFYRRPRLALFS